jgi:hypothetical protein
MPEGFVPGCEIAAEGHRDPAKDHAPGRDVRLGRGMSRAFRREAEYDVEYSESDQ